MAKSVVEEYESKSKRVISLASKIEQTLDSSTSIPNCNNCVGFIRTSQMEYEYPFAMPGATGIRQAACGNYSPDVINGLVEHGMVLCGFDEQMFKKASRKIRRRVIEGLFSVSMGAAGYACGYEHEIVDDTCNVWAAMGGMKDCEDFATACVSLITSIKQTPIDNSQLSPMAYDVVKFIQENVEAAYVTSGWVQINIQDYAKSQRESETLEGHAWVTVKLLSKYMFIECTTPMLPHQTPESYHLFYGNIFDLRPAIKCNNDVGYGPAHMQPLDRYKAVCYFYDGYSGYAICEQKHKVGATVENLFKEKIQLVPLWNDEMKQIMSEFRRLDINPSITLCQSAFSKVDKKIRDIDQWNMSKFDNVYNAMPRHHVKFIPASELKKGIDLDGFSGPICIFKSVLMPYAQGIYVGYANTSAAEFRYL